MSKPAGSTGGVDYRLLGQSYQLDGEMIEQRRFDGMSDLAKKYNLDPTVPRDYMKLKQMLRKGSKLPTPPVDVV